MAVRVGDELSAWEPVSPRVPQGSVLGPPLFLIFLNDMPAITTNTTMLFADDSKLIRKVRSPETIQSVLNSLSQWTHVWQMKINESKCSVLHIGKDNPKWNHTMCNSPLQGIEKERYLGVVYQLVIPFVGKKIHEKLLEKHITSWIIRNVVSGKPEVLIPFYKAFVRPHLEYAVQMWAPTARHGN